MDKIELQMLNIFKQAQSKMLDELLKWINWTTIQTIATLKAITNELVNTYWQFQTIVSQEWYIKGGIFYDKELENKLEEIKKLLINERIVAGAETVNWLWEVHTLAVKNLIQSWNAYMEQTILNIQKWIIWQMSQYQILTTFENIWLWVLSWSSLQKTKEDLVKFRKESFPYFRDKWWKLWTLERYGEMLIKTESWKAYNTGILNQWVELWVIEYKRFETSDSCPICIPHKWEIRNVSKNWFPILLYHPNCRWNWQPIVK